MVEKEVVFCVLFLEMHRWNYEKMSECESLKKMSECESLKKMSECESLKKAQSDRV